MLSSSSFTKLSLFKVLEVLFLCVLHLHFLLFVFRRGWTLFAACSSQQLQARFRETRRQQ